MRSKRTIECGFDDRIWSTGTVTFAAFMKFETKVAMSTPFMHWWGVPRNIMPATEFSIEPKRLTTRKLRFAATSALDNDNIRWADWKANLIDNKPV